jgi:beta-N-acetylhexosaminidase
MARLPARVLALLVITAVALSGCGAVRPAAPGVLIGLPVAPAVDPIAQYADDRLESMTWDEKVRSMLMVHLAGTDAAAIASFAEGVGAGGVILMGDNIPDPPEALAEMTPILAGEAALPRRLALEHPVDDDGPR